MTDQTFTSNERARMVNRADTVATITCDLVTNMLDHDLSAGDRDDAVAALEACHALHEAHRLAVLATNILDGTATPEERHTIRQSMERRAVERFAQNAELLNGTAVEAEHEAAREEAAYRLGATYRPRVA